jgi:hypothetical protein
MALGGRFHSFLRIGAGELYFQDPYILFRDVFNTQGY